MKKIIFLLFTCISIDAIAQSVGIGITVPHPTAALEIRSTNKGLLFPRLTAAARQSMFGVPAGMMVYDTEASTFYFHDGNKWRPIHDVNADSTLIDYGVTPEVTANISTFVSTSARSGILYDFGGPAGNYMNNAIHDYEVNIGPNNGGNDSIAFFKVVVEEMSLESPYDSLRIYTDESYPITITGTTTRTYYLPAIGNLRFSFRSNAANTQAGFKIRWSQLVARSTEVPPLMGWHFDPQRRSVRGGLNIQEDWDTENLGNVSFGWGVGTKATGNYSMAVGREMEAQGDYSAAIGYRNIAMGSGSIALGQQSTTGVQGHYSMAMGFGCDARGGRSLAINESSTTIGMRSIAGIQTSRAQGNNSIALGWNTVAKGYTTVFGRWNDTIGNVSDNGWVDTEPLFMIGNGTMPSNRNNAMMITKEGNMALGVRIPSTRFHIGGGSDASLSNSSGYMVIGDINNTNIVFDNNEIMARDDGASSTLYLQNDGGAFEIGGTAAKPGGGAWLATSDARLKQDVRPYTDGLQQLLGIDPVYYHYNKQSGYDTQREYVGVLAQDLRKVAPYMVSTFTRNGEEYLSVDNTAMMYMLINAVKEQQQQIEALKKKIQVLEASR